MSQGAVSLSGLDSTMLHLESPRTPMHIASVGIFEGAPLFDADGRLRIDDIRARITSRLEMAPKLRRRISWSRCPGIAPAWVDDDHFDIRAHVRCSAVPPPGTEEQLAEVCAGMMATPLSRARPLWELRIVVGLEGGRVAMVEKVHHALADGLAGVDVATVLFDAEPDPHLGVDPGDPWHPNPATRTDGVAAADLRRLGGTAWDVAGRALAAVRTPARAVSSLTGAARALGTLATPALAAPRSSLNSSIGPDRVLAFVRQPLDVLRRIDRSFGVTLNDVLLAAVAGGVRRLMQERGERVDGREIQVLVPVGRQHGPGRRLGNDVSALLVRLPIGLSDPRERLARVAAQVADRKRRHQDAGADLVLSLLEPMPQRAIGQVARLVHHQPFVNLVVTNVPGPSVPLYAMGARLLEAFPMVPLGGNLSVGIAALSYDGQLGLGLLADPEACPDLDVLAGGLGDAFAELADLARSA